ncbi:hypothetical protein [Sinorhizobium meliloti]|uniref:hypothetical protein n=1 Tax=Rhizobium meliloti TaxID=382 RepID=UPI000FD9C30F|nr:hypothetical protein [Sinorhizobium meliloti]RVG29722.1 hypothetical protein CN225_23945 [Sinorhizobium meliloti]
MTDHPLLFSGLMVRALLDGRKTQTRRLLTPHNTFFDGRPWSKLAKAQEWDWGNASVDNGPSPAGNPGPYLHLPWLAGDADPFEQTVHRIYPKVQPGDRIWVKETHAIVPSTAYRMSTGVEQTVNPADRDDAAVYREGWERSAPSWKPSIFMPRWASRLTLPVMAVKIERLQDISDADATAEGLAGVELDGMDPRGWYRDLWDSINGVGAWAANPWVIAYSFDPLRKNIDEVAR